MIVKFTDASPDFAVLLAGSERRRALLRTLAEERAAHRLSHTQVAAAMGISQPTLARLETTASDIKLSTVERFAGALGYGVEYCLVPSKRSKSKGGRCRGPGAWRRQSLCQRAGPRGLSVTAASSSGAA